MMLNEVRRKPEKPRVRFDAIVKVWYCRAKNDITGIGVSPAQAYYHWIGRNAKMMK